MTEIPETITRTTCRVCESKKLIDLFSVGNQYINNFVPEEKVYSGIKAPLDLIFCENCTLVQLRHTAPQELLYKGFYWYKSGITDTMKSHLRDITKQAEEKFGLVKGDVVLDIGSNDGTMLRTYSVPGLVTIGVEPADNLKEEGEKGISHHIHGFWEYDSYMENVGKKAKIVTAIGMFYDMENPNQFISDAGKALTDDGVFIAQLMCLKNMLDTNDVGNICHEHLEYYSFSALEYLFNKNGLEIFDIEKNNVNGGSYRIFAKLKGSLREQTEVEKARIEAVKESEKDLQKKETYQKFFERLEDNKKKCIGFIREKVSEGKKVWVYGASTKGNVILQYYGLDHNLIKYASERSPWKWGKHTIGTGIKCVSEEEAREEQPDYFLVLPYTFFNEMYEREAEWRAKGGKFIVPLPEFKVVD
jgi:NDP-4-keto-2,6-dideoxyhexose 3-C-methyltransferase